MFKLFTYLYKRFNMRIKYCININNALDNKIEVRTLRGRKQLEMITAGLDESRKQQRYNKESQIQEKLDHDVGKLIKNDQRNLFEEKQTIIELLL